MHYPQLNGTGIRISSMILGGVAFGEHIDERKTEAIVKQALDLGITTFDTAGSYGMGRSEEYLGRALASVRDNVIICTKVGTRVGDLPSDLSIDRPPRYDYRSRMSRGVYPNEQGASRSHIIRAAEASLKRLGTDYIDLYQLHNWDPTCPIDETLSALSDLVHAGKVRYIGCSSYSGWQLYRALWASELRGHVRPTSTQERYSLLVRDAEAEVIPACIAANIAVLCYQVLAAGLLTGRYSRAPEPPRGTHLANRPILQKAFWSEQTFDKIEVYAAAAEAMGISLSQLAIAWNLHQPGVTAVLVGAEEPDELIETVAAADISLSVDDLAVLDPP